MSSRSRSSSRGDHQFTPRDLKRWLDDGGSIPDFAAHHGVPVADVRQLADDYALVDESSSLAIDEEVFRQHLDQGGSAWSFARDHGISAGRVYQFAKEHDIDIRRAKGEDSQRTQDIVRRYLAGESGTAIGKSYNMSRQRVNQIVRSHGIVRRVEVRRQALDEHRDAIIDRLQAGEDSEEIGDALGIPTSWIQAIRRDERLMPSHVRRREKTEQGVKNAERMRRLSVAILQSGYSQNELAKKLKETPLRLSNMLSGIRPNDKLMARVAKFLKLDLQWVETGDSDYAPDWLGGMPLGISEASIRLVNSNIRLLHTDGHAQALLDNGKRRLLGIRDLMRILRCTRGRAMAILSGRTNGLLIFEKIAADFGIDSEWFCQDNGGPKQPGGARGPKSDEYGDDGRAVDHAPIVIAGSLKNV